MTCIAAIGDPDKKIVVMGGDRAVSDSTGYISKTSHPKVFRRYQYLLGYAGSVRFGKLIEHGFEPPEYKGIEFDGDLDEFMNTQFISVLSNFLQDHNFSMFDDKPEVGTTTSGLLVGIEGRIFEIDYDYAAIEFADNYAAIGSANDLAIGAICTYKNLYPNKYYRENILNALKIASKHSTTCSEPFDIISIGE